MTETELIHQGWDMWDVDEWLSRQLAAWATWRIDMFKQYKLGPQWL